MFHKIGRELFSLCGTYLVSGTVRMEVKESLLVLVILGGARVIFSRKSPGLKKRQQ
jgi:hypothetical protein